ncbi:GGDEF domain-containing protein [Allokutzneria sp. A3M-2-11 16]|uniref:diguanylate cyclase domain-containing protein n=1 Tax=Allokutzneria sp. A3M-2-11 16 TaxID=2962043 RepID=UPI0020B7D90B|nr:diguanylate cyclase [Allokutzneria sp. A3M-2-11 16]MCP3799187.1 GGDEF domain-containing protein [Allokutzneria sp. A3M-2-11 16]
MKNLKTFALVLLATLIALMVAVRLSGLPVAFAWRFDKLLEVGANLAAVIGFTITARRAPGTDRRWRVLLAVAAVLRLVFCVLYFWVDVSGGDIRAALNSAPPIFTVSTLLTLAAVVVLARRNGPTPRRSSSRDRLLFWLDGLIVTSSAVVLTWVTAVHPVLLDDQRVLNPLVLMSRPIEFLVLLVILMALSRKRQEERQIAMLLVGMGFFAQICGSWGVGYLIPKGVPFDTARFMADITFVCAGVFYALTPWVPVRSRDSGPRRKAGLADHMHFVAPYLPVLATLMFIGLSTAVGGKLSAGETYIELGVVAIVLIRQFVTMVDNERLVRRLWDHQRRLRYQAYHDALTGLPNRIAFREQLQQLLAHPGTEPAVLFVDLDDFKTINDRYGHAAGDRVLAGIAARLRAVVRAPDMVARLGGDEFGVLLVEPGERGNNIGEKLLTELSKPYSVDGVEHTVRASIGLASAADARDVEDAADQLLRLADGAMYLAKNRGKGTLAVHLAT